MLFLAVTGALAVGVLATSSIAINQQRYRDTLNSLQSTIQQQFNEAANVINDRSGDDTRCDGSGVSEAGGGSSAQPRGTSDCLVLGRSIQFDSAGKIMTLASVVGYKPASAPAVNNDLDALKQYSLSIAPTNQSTAEVAWGANVFDRESGKTGSLQLLVLRSPLTGSLRTFVLPASMSGTINSGDLVEANMAERDLCVDTGGFTIANTLGVVIRANASSASAVELLGDDQKC